MDRHRISAPASDRAGSRAWSIAAVPLALAVLATAGSAQAGPAGGTLASLSIAPRTFTLAIDPPPRLAIAADESSPWHFKLTPFFWMAGLDADVSSGNISASASPSFNDLLDHLNSALMLNGEIGYRKWSLFSDFIWLELKEDNLSGPLGKSSVDLRFQELIGSANLAYQLLDIPLDQGRADGPRLVVEPYAGVRYTNLDANLNFKTLKTRSSTFDWWDPLVGVRARAGITSTITLFGRWDFGGWGVGCDHTWFVLGGIEWRAFESTTFGLGYAALYQDYHASNFSMRTTMQGPVISATFRF